jgi:hypothetical protein
MFNTDGQQPIFQQLLFTISRTLEISDDVINCTSSLSAAVPADAAWLVSSSLGLPVVAHRGAGSGELQRKTTERECWLAASRIVQRNRFVAFHN